MGMSQPQGHRYESGAPGSDTDMSQLGADTDMSQPYVYIAVHRLYGSAVG